MELPCAWSWTVRPTVLSCDGELSGGRERSVRKGRHDWAAEVTGRSCGTDSAPCREVIDTTRSMLSNSEGESETARRPEAQPFEEVVR